MSAPVIKTDFPDLPLLKRGKVRDLYDLDDCLLMVATDRISAFDVVMPNPIPDKGKILTQISLFWFAQMRPLIGNHVISADVERYPDRCRPYADELRDRSLNEEAFEPTYPRQEFIDEMVAKGEVRGKEATWRRKDGWY